MELKKIGKEQYKKGSWSGGTTTELAIYPTAAVYEERDFIWRLSSATVAVEESDFTSLPDYDRTLIVLEGEAILVHKGVRAVKLSQHEKDCFSGSYDTKSYGKITDFNLMVRKDNSGFAQMIDIKESHTILDIKMNEAYEKLSVALYCTQGFCSVSMNDKSCLLKAGEAAIYDCTAIEAKNLAVMGQGKTVMAQILFNETKGYSSEQGTENEMQEVREETVEKKKRAAKAEKIPITSEDVKWASLVCWSSFRGGKRIFKCFRGMWFDRKLEKGIGKLENMFLPVILCFAGLGVIAMYTWENYSQTVMIWSLSIWLIADILLINPLLFLMVLPRPIKSHIKKISELEGEDLKLYEKQQKENKMADKILKRYEFTGRNKYID